MWSTEKPTYQHTNCVEFHVYKLCMCTVHCACCHTYLNRRLRSLSPVFQISLAHFAVAAAVAAARSQCKRMHSFSMNSRRTKRADTKKKHLKNSQYSREVLNFLWIRSCIFVIIAIYSRFKMWKTAKLILSCKSLREMLWPDSHILWTFI